ncbi:MAG: DNA topoisomerase IV subunit A, partial [Acetobacterales bacterium]
ALMDGIDEDAVDFRDTYDGEEREPVVMPAAFPNLLANGSQGIAVGMATSIPPHNLGELCKALLQLIRKPDTPLAGLLKYVKGPDFPTGGELVESAETLREAYAAGRGSFRVRARWVAEELTRGQYQVVVTEVPFQVPKARLVERIADLMQAKKLPLLADIRDESTDEVRLVLEPRSRAVEPEVLMESLFRLTDLESRFSLNMNVLDADHTPRVMDLKEVLQAFLDHRHTVLVRRSEHRLGKIEHRLEVLDGYLVAYLNLDEVIRIIREEDDPKAEMMRRFELTEVQADAILNMRLRALRKLEEFEIRKEHKALSDERGGLNKLLKDPNLRWARIGEEIAAIDEKFGGKTELGRRRTLIGGPPAAVEVPTDVMVEREPVTVVCSEKGWIRAAKGHLEDPASLKFKEGDRPRFLLHAQTTDKVLLFATNGRFYTLSCDRLPGARGHGEPVRLMLELPNDVDIVTLRVLKAGEKLLVASSGGRGFLVACEEVVAQTRGGKQVLNLGAGEEAAACVPADGDTVAVVGDNRKLLVFPLPEMPEMTRGRGVKLQSYRDGGLADVQVFTLAEGLSWRLGDRTRTETDIGDWVGKRAQSGRLAPRGFPKSNRFG